jgi:CRISPR-associated protein Csm1
VAEQILQELNLTAANLLFLGGGHFYLLAPRTDAVHATVSRWQELVNKVLARAYGGRLALVLHQEAVTYRQFLRGPDGFADVWRRAATRLAREKRRKFASCWQDERAAAAILGPFPALIEERSCEICAEEIAPGSDEKTCPTCQSFAELATRSSRADFLETILQPPRQLPGSFSSYRQVFQALGITFNFKQQGESFHPHHALRLNTADLSTLHGPCRGFAFLAHHVPRHPTGEVKTLEDLAGAARGIKKWGLLQADVDNLGKIFTDGLGEEDRTLSRVSTLSQLLSLFFSGHVQHFISTDPAYRDSIYLVYAGGDDLCLLGPWSALPDLAQRLRQDFHRWTRGHLTLSAGLYLAPRDKFPVYQAADAAGDLLDAAKRHRPEKDSLGILNQAVRWRDMATVAEVKDLLVALLDRHGVPRALLALLKASWLEHEQHERGAVPIYRVWNLLYGLHRLTERLSREKNYQAVPIINALEQKLISNYNLRAHTDIAIRWAEFLTRKED